MISTELSMNDVISSTSEASYANGTGAAAAMPPDRVEQDARDTPHILLVDDNADHLFLARRQVEENLRCRVTTAETGQEALNRVAQLNTNALDVVVLDNGLPDMSGLDVLAQMRGRGDVMPVIIVTGQGSEAIAVEALRRGANDYIVKTGDYLQIFPEVVAQVIERERMRLRNLQLEAEHVRFARLAAIGEVAAGIAHEIRNPMTVILGMASLIRDNYQSLPAQELHNCARAIADNCTHLNRVLEEVLGSTQVSHKNETLMLSELMDETISFLRFDLDFRHRMEVTRNYQKCCPVVGDRDQLKQVFINLFRNAAQAVQMAGKSRGLLDITINGDKEKGEIFVQILDDGQGIPEDLLPRIFESGFSTKQRNGEVRGSGLGLSICRRIVEHHRGRLWAEAREPGTGALFCLVLPIATNEEQATPEE
jgi:signal transduction histidine kinase